MKRKNIININMQINLVVYWMIALITVFQAKCLWALEEQNGVVLYMDNKNQSIRIEPILNIDSESGKPYIQFNVSCPHCNQDNNCTVRISRIRNSCIGGIPIDIMGNDLLFSLNSSLIIVPENDEQLVPSPGCSYRFENLKEFVDDSCNIASNISLPACIGNKCNCNEFKFNFINLTAELNDDVLTIIADAEFENELNVSAVKYKVNIKSGAPQSTEGESHPTEVEGIYQSDDYHHIEFNLTLIGNPSTYTQGWQCELKYINARDCEDAFTFKDLNFVIELKKKSEVHFIVIAGICGILMMILVVVLKSKMKSTDPVQNVNNYFRQTFPNPLYLEVENGGAAQGDPQEYDPREIKIIQSIGEGAFGDVFLAKSDKIYAEYGGLYKYIAIKKLKGNATEQMQLDFIRETSIMLKITDFAHVVRLLGYCTLATPYMLITEHINSGDLKSYLVELREVWAHKSKSKCFSGEYVVTINDRPVSPETPSSFNSESDCNSRITRCTYVNQLSPLIQDDSKFKYQLEHVLDNKELQNFALQIAQGMAHLETIPIIHRDLAARNVLINDCKVLKISDFGLSCMGDENTTLKDKECVPIRWTAVDVFDTRTYDMKSDVWSFAVVLWEIGMLGAYPYQNIEHADILIAYLRNDNNRLERPPICSEDLYDLMLRCWRRDSTLRPSFRDVVDLLDSKKKRIYETFDFLNPTYEFPPTEEKD